MGQFPSLLRIGQGEMGKLKTSIKYCYDVEISSRILMIFSTSKTEILEDEKLFPAKDNSVESCISKYLKCIHND